MSINQATPQDWNRLRQKHPAIDESLMKVYLDMAEAEPNPFDDAEQDAVNNPDHYNTGNVECIEAIEESMTPEAFRGYLKGNCMKLTTGSSMRPLSRCRTWRRSMPLTFKEVCERLSQIDEVTLLEVLDIASEDIVNKFKDKIEERLDSLEEELQ